MLPEDFVTPNDRKDDPGLSLAECMNGPMDPVVPCVVMPTRHCVARWDVVGSSAHEVPASILCPDICWRYSRPVKE